MKKTICFMSCTLLAIVVMFSACRRSDIQQPNHNNGLYQDTKVVPASASRAQANRESADLGEPTGLLSISPELFYALSAGQYIGVQSMGNHQYNATSILTPPTGTLTPTPGPCEQDWIDFAKYMDANRAAWQAYANATCRPVRGCWTGRCVCIAWRIDPNDFANCMMVEQQYQSVLQAYEGGIGIGTH
jgi:hypothetical protein